MMKELKEKITYTYIRQDEYDRGECNTGVYFPTFEQARRTAEVDQPANKPYYIVERVECFTVCGVVERKINV